MKNTIDPDKFLDAWISSTSQKEVAAKMNIGINSVQYKAHALRKNGVNLPEFKKGGGISSLTPERIQAMNEKIKAKVNV